ncbi:MAG: translocation/assembly module TamB domain-containing protein [Balneolales bacterium]
MLVLLITVFLFCGVFFLMLQTQPVKNHLSQVVESWFNENFQGTISVGEIGGILPLRANINEVTLTYNDEQLASFESLGLSIDLIALFRNHLTINDISLVEPSVTLHMNEGEERFTIADALTRLPAKINKETHSTYFRSIDIYAPFMQIKNGSLRIQSLSDHLEDFPMSIPSRVENINTDIFLEISSNQRYLDISFLTMDFPEFKNKQLAVSGQIYNDSRYLEFNAMHVQMGESHIDFDSESSGINLLEDDLRDQFLKASFLVIMQDAFLSAEDMALIIPDWSDQFPEVQLAFEGNGQSDAMSMRNTEVRLGNSSIQLDADVQNMNTLDSMNYNLDIKELRLDPSELAWMLPDLDSNIFRDVSSLAINGLFKGKGDSADIDLSIRMPEGSMAAAGEIVLEYPFNINAILSGREIDLSSMSVFGDIPTQINTDIIVSGERIAESDRYFELSIDLFESTVGKVELSSVHIDAEYEFNVVQHQFSLSRQDRFLEGQGRIDMQQTVPNIVLTGNSSNLNLQEIIRGDQIPETEWNMSFDLNWHGLTPDDFFGRIIIDVDPSLVNGSELQAHQVYLDLNQPDSETRSLRLTSSMFDLLMEGDIKIPSMLNLAEHWGNYFSQHIREELFLESPDIFLSSYAESDSTIADMLLTDTLPANSILTGYADSTDVLQSEIYLELKNINLLKYYIPGIPEISSNAILQLHLNADEKALDLHADWRDLQMLWNGIATNRSEISVATNFRFDQHFRNYSRVDVKLNVENLVYHDQEVEGLSWLLSVEDGSILSHTSIDRYGENVRFDSELHGQLTDSMLVAEIKELVIGDDLYLWQTDATPVLQYEHDGRLRIDEFKLLSGYEEIYLNGVFSALDTDSVQYRFVNVDLERISNMIEGKLEFTGILNAEFITQSLTQLPVFHGYLDVDRLSFNTRVIGDVHLNSVYHTENDRFDTELSVYTDSVKYADYLERNNGIGQNIFARGWFKRPNPENMTDSLYYFDVDAEEVDVWVLSYLMDNIFDSIEGKATGKGYLTGNLDYIDFNSDFEIYGATVLPVFFGAEYILNGPVSVSRDDGVQLHQLNVHDRGNGTGVLSGSYSFNDFQAERPLDITLRMENLLFLNNSDGPDVPFFGRVHGTGIVNISGTNISPYVRTIEPIETTPESNLSIPLMNQEADEYRGRFIRFVNDFNEVDLQRHTEVNPEVLQNIERNFMEVFRLDLQFIAAANSTLQLIFDPVTGEIVNAYGDGRIRITLEDETLQMFGNFNISDGDYLFVGGDILTRRFTLRDGGSIRWDGDPENALLNIISVYRARPNIAPLLGAAIDQPNRIPVELLLEITGPIENITNDFYFEFPNAIDATQNAAVLNVLNSEEQKLIQATSLLFTGAFISGAMVGDSQTQELGSTLQARAGQVGISQLLSSQINTLLSENLINLDVDLNLFGFDQADLGIALRLFDDRLVLRREGEVGGEETNIGDLGATYRINPNLSVEVFHRKDPVLLSILGTQADVENVNGVGLEAQFRFNTWKEFGQRIWQNVSTGFGLWDHDQTEPGPEDEVTSAN